MKTNQFDKIFEKKCDVCGKTLLASKTGKWRVSTLWLV